MTRPRNQLICIEETPYYHVTSRCVRRTFLCGFDAQSGHNYEHRRLWIEERIRILSSLFAIDIAAYAVMSNHYHMVIKLHPDEVKTWDDEEVCRRWFCLFQGPLVMQMHRDGKLLNSAQQATVAATIQVWRERLQSLSWFMKCLNEPIARMANQEDHCTGHFWEARYKSQCLKTEHALLSCMAYVELNPLRASMADTPETAEHTSIKERIKPTIDLKQAIQEQITNGQLIQFDGNIKPLMPFLDSISPHANHGLPCFYIDYLSLVDWTGRILRQDKRGAINNHLPSILKRLKLPAKTWLKNATQFEQQHPKIFNNEPPSGFTKVG